MNWTIRSAAAGDAADIFRLIHELAEFEHLSHQVELRVETLSEWLASGRVGCLLAELDGERIGFALYYFTYSTFRGKRGIFLEDIFVRPAFRQQGIGREFFRRLAEIARSLDCFRFDWLVLNWNDGGKHFYETVGAGPVRDWTLYRLTGPALEDLRLPRRNPTQM